MVGLVSSIVVFQEAIAHYSVLPRQVVCDNAEAGKRNDELPRAS